MKSTLLMLFLVGISFGLTGCVTCQECGSLKRNHEITRLFMNNEIVPGYSYYFNGSTQWPSAVMAIDSNYSIMAQFWKPVELEGQDMSSWLRNAVNWKGELNTKKNGAEILSPEGVRVGIFFSKYDNLITKFQSDKVIQVYAPSYLAGQGRGETSRYNK